MSTTTKLCAGEDDSAYDSSSHSSQSSNGSSSTDDSTKKLVPHSVCDDNSPTGKLTGKDDIENGDAVDNDEVNYKDVTYQTSTRFPSAKLTYILVGIAVLLSMATLVVTVVTALQTKGQPSKRPPLSFPETCVPCIKLILNPYEPFAADPVLDKLDKKLTNGIQMCCAKTSAQMSAMLECGLRDQVTRPLPSPEASKDLKFVPASLHKKLLPPTEEDCSEGGHCHMRFDPNFHDFQEHVRSVNVSDTFITINYTGLYYIYTNIYFDIKTAPTTVNEQSVFQYVERVRPNSPANSGLLLQTSHTTCIGCSNDKETAFTGGVFHLKAKDQLYVCVTERHAHTHQITDLSFFGLIMLSSDKRDNK